jgi:hypothetical protein
MKSSFSKLSLKKTANKGYAANESETKPPNPDKNRTSKPPMGGASLTELLGMVKGHLGSNPNATLY